MAAVIDVRALGSLEVRADGAPIVVAGAKPRAVLALLALHCGHEVSADSLIDTLWGDDPPRTAKIALRTHISALRRTIGDYVVTRGSGWVLTRATGDAAEFEAAAQAGRTAANSGDPHTAVAVFDDALRLWRGTPELPDTAKGNAEIARWQELRDTVVEDRVDAMLALGESARLVGELEAAVAEAPLRERRWAQLMLALYRGGRQADALDAYRRARDLLSDQLGVEPGPELRRLERAVLAQDPGLTAPRRPLTESAAARPAPTGVPAQHTTFVGRRVELGQVSELLRAQSLVTVVGPGGVGKTRLAVAAAAECAQPNMVFVDLVPVSPTYVVAAVAAALRVAERPQQPLVDAVRDRFGNDRWLLVLDNCEHLLDEVSEFVSGTLRSCPGVVVLATSRERLGAPGERLVSVGPLSLVSAETEEAKGSEAVTLFLDRARSVDPEFDADPDMLGEICARLDGIPLAIELAAARSVSLGIDGVIAGLDDRMRLLSGARGTGRHRSLRAVLDWSHDLLDAEERAAFRHVAVFAGNFDLAAAASLASPNNSEQPTLPALADLLGRLTDKNLLVHRHADGHSFWYLLEIVRDYALEQLADSDAEQLVAAHLRWAADTAQRLEEQLVAGMAWRAEFAAVLDDLRTALSRAPVPDSTAYRLATVLGHLTYARGLFAEAHGHYLEAAQHGTGQRAAEALRAAADVAIAETRYAVSFDLQLQAAEASEENSLRSIALASAVRIAARFPGGFAEPLTLEQLDELLDRARQLADGSPLVTAHLATAAACTGVPVRAQYDEPLSTRAGEAAPLAERALEATRNADDPTLRSAALDSITFLRYIEGRYRDAAREARKRVDLLDSLDRHDPHSGGEIVDILYMDSEAALWTGDLVHALSAARRASDDPLGSGVARLAASRLVLPLTLSGAFGEALDTTAEMWADWQRAGEPHAPWLAPAVKAAALVHGLLGDQQAYRHWSEQAKRLSERPHILGFEPFVECRVALHVGRLSDSTKIALGMPAQHLGPFDAYARAITAEATAVVGLPDASARLDAVVPLAAENDWVAACLHRARGRLTGDRDLLQRSVVGWERIDARFERACTLLLLDDRASEGAAELNALGSLLPASGY